jgi:hypothetical protein
MSSASRTTAASSRAWRSSVSTRSSSDRSIFTESRGRASRRASDE